MSGPRIRNQSAQAIQRALLAKFSTIQDAARLRRRAAAGARYRQRRRFPHDGAGSRRQRARRALQQAVGAMMAQANQTPGPAAGVLAVRELDAAALSRHRPCQGADARHQRDRRVHGAADLSRLGLRQRLQSARAHLPRDGAGRQQLPRQHQGRPQAPRAQLLRRYGAARIVHDGARHFGPVARSALQPLSRGRARRLCGARLLAGPGDRPHAEACGRDAAAAASATSGRSSPSSRCAPATPRRSPSRSASCSCSSCWPRSSRA